MGRLNGQKKVFITLIILLLLLLTASAANAHSLGTMGGSQWVIGKNNIRISMELSPDLLNMLPVIKKRHNVDSCTAPELQRIATNILQPYIDRKLSVWINGFNLPVMVEGLSRKGYLYELQLSVANIGRVVRSSGNTIKIDYRLFFDESDGMHINITTLISGNKQRNEMQNQFTADNTVWEIPFTAQPLPFWATAVDFVVLGIKHILTGYDHILFLLALIVIGLSVREVLRIISSFTIAHSITLFLAALHIVRLNSRFVEAVIALSICYVAMENLFRKKAAHRPWIAFGFGLIHGFGFASILQDLALAKSNLILSVLSFNVGVETGQLLIFVVMMPVLYYLKTRLPFRKFTMTASTAIFVLGAVWFVERVFSLRIFRF